MTLPKKVLAVILPLGLGAALVLAQGPNTSAPAGTTIVQKSEASSQVGQPGQANRDMNLPQNVGEGAPVQVAQTQTQTTTEQTTTEQPATPPPPASAPPESGTSATAPATQSSPVAEPSPVSKSESSYGATTSSTTTTTTTKESQQLPKTASELPLLALAGILALGGGLGLNALRR